MLEKIFFKAQLKSGVATNKQEAAKKILYMWSEYSVGVEMCHKHRKLDDVANVSINFYASHI